MPRVPKRVIDLVWLRDEGRCFHCGKLLLRNRGGYSIHHRRARGMGGNRQAWVSQPSNLILLCGSGVDGCHGWVEGDFALANEMGLRLGMGEDPAATPAVRWNRWLVWLHDDGRIEAALS